MGYRRCHQCVRRLCHSMSSVHILATCRKPELLPYTLLVFRTLRVGFPTAAVEVTGNALQEFALKEVAHAAESIGCKFTNGQETLHHLWIESLIDSAKGPMWLCDCDMIFYAAVEGWQFETPLAGW